MNILGIIRNKFLYFFCIFIETQIMGISIEEQRERIRKQRNPKRFYKVKTKKKKELNKRKNYKKYLLSDEWANLKIDLFNHRGKECEICGSNKNIEVHHNSYKNIFKEEPEDLDILCRKCHTKKHSKRVKG